MENTGLNPRALKCKSPPSRASDVSEIFAREGGSLHF